MKTHTVIQWLKQRFYEDNKIPGVDPYIGQCDWIEITPDVLYATGFMVRTEHKSTKAEYAQGLLDVGANEMMYYRPDNKPVFGGEQLLVLRDGQYQPVKGLYLKKL